LRRANRLSRGLQPVGQGSADQRGSRRPSVSDCRARPWRADKRQCVHRLGQQQAAAAIVE
jgi:hypothetical protein